MSRYWQAILTSLVLCVGVFALDCDLADAAVAKSVDDDAAAAEISVAPNTVTLGLYLTSLYDFDMAKRSFNAVFWAWFKSSDPAFKPLATVEVTNARTVVNRYDYKQEPSQDGGTVITAAKYYVNITQDWDTVYFPFDRQTLKIYFEDSASDLSAMKFVPDVGNSGIDAPVSIPGWTIERFSVYADDSSYDSNFGSDGASVPSRYSRFVAEISVKRTGMRLFLNIYAGFFVAFLLTFLTYFMDVHSMAGNRIGLCGGAIFASVGNKYIVDNTLPLTSQFTLTDSVELATFSAIVICIITALSVKALEERHTGAAKVINGFFGGTSLIGYIAAIGLMIFKSNV